MCSAVWGQKGKIQSKNRWKREETWWKTKWPLPQKVDEGKIARLASRLSGDAGGEAVAAGRGGSQIWGSEDKGRNVWMEDPGSGPSLLRLHRQNSNQKKGEKVPLSPWSAGSKIGTRNVTLSAEYFTMFSNVSVFSCGYWLLNNCCEWQLFVCVYCCFLHHRFLLPGYIQS